MHGQHNHEESEIAKHQLKEAIGCGELTLGPAVRQMREITGKNHKAYAQEIIGISPRVLAEIERDMANPTIETLNKRGRPTLMSSSCWHLRHNQWHIRG